MLPLKERIKDRKRRREEAEEEGVKTNSELRKEAEAEALKENEGGWTA